MTEIPKLIDHEKFMEPYENVPTAASDVGVETDKPKDTHSPMSATTIPKECKSNPNLSWSCMLGTRGCDIKHQLLPSEDSIRVALQGRYGFPFLVKGRS